MKKYPLKNIMVILVMYMAFLTVGISQKSTNLDQILAEVIESSYKVESASIQKGMAEEDYKFFKSFLKPNIAINGTLPNYSKTSVPVTQPDGTIFFQSIRQANSVLSLSAEQIIPATGGVLFLNTDLQRFDDFGFKSHQYNGTPIRLGVSQPIFGFNSFKYRKDIERLNLEETTSNYKIEIEESLGLATDYYFDILIAKQNLDIANTNQKVNEKLLTITEKRLELGKVSKDEKLQLEIELNGAKLSVSQANSELDQSIARLYTFLGKEIPIDIRSFDIPQMQIINSIDEQNLIGSFMKNRPEILAFQRDLKTAQMNSAKVKADYGFQANLEASVGLARGAETIDEIYSDPFDQQQFNLSLSIPLLDWGKKKAALAQLDLQKEDLRKGNKQLVLEMKNNIVQRSSIFKRIQNDLELLKEIMNKAEERFQISNERYVLGNIDITNLTLAQREKDQAKRNYINSLKSLWTTYYELRALTGYDIIKQQEVNYH